MLTVWPVFFWNWTLKSRKANCRSEAAATRSSSAPAFLSAARTPRRSKQARIPRMRPRLCLGTQSLLSPLAGSPRVWRQSVDMPRTYWESNSKNHDFSGFDQRGGQVAGLQAQFPCRVRRDNRSDALLADGEFYLGQQSAEFHAHHAADELIPAADSAEVAAAPAHGAPRQFFRQQPVNFALRDAMVSAGGFRRLDFFLVDPLLQSGIADPQDIGRLARRQQIQPGHSVFPRRYSLIRFEPYIPSFQLRQAECVFRASRRKPGNAEARDCVQSARTQAFETPVSRVMHHAGKTVHRRCSTSRQTILGHLSNEIGSGAKLLLRAWKYGISGWDGPHGARAAGRDAPRARIFPSRHSPAPQTRSHRRLFAWQ